MRATAVLAVAALTLVVVAAAMALDGTESNYTTIQTNGGANNVPGQKDLTMMGQSATELPSTVNVLWNWDELSVSGNNTLDGCALFDSDSPSNGKVDFAVCASVKKSGSSLALVTGTPVLYSCGDARADRCSSTVTALNSSPQTECTLRTNSSTDPFSGGSGYPYDTRILCAIKLSDIPNTSTAQLINVCSYPSQQPNSDPSDCVLIDPMGSPSGSGSTTVIPQASVSISGILTGGSATGTADRNVVFTLYDGTDLNCNQVVDTTEGTTNTAAPALYTRTLGPVTADGSFTTDNAGGTTQTARTLTASGTYNWKIVYNGDSKNNPFTINCGVEQTIVTLT